MIIKTKSKLIVKTFVQRVSSATTFTKRFKTVCRLLDSRPQLSEDQWLYIWRGLYYSVWYSEMGKGCEELIQRIGSHDDLTMILSGFKALTNDWYGIDAFRIDKYMFLVRVLANNCLKLQFNALLNPSMNTNDIKMSETNESEDNQKNESEDNVEDVVEDEEEVKTSSDNQKESKEMRFKFNKKFKKRKQMKKKIEIPIEMSAKMVDNILTIINPSIGLTLHMTDVFIDEFINGLTELRPKVESRIDLYFNVLLPFVKLMALSDDYRVLNNVKHNVFDRFKNEILISESVDTRKLVLQKFIDAMVSIGAVETIGRRNRDSIYNLIETFKTKAIQLNKTNDNTALKRKKILIGKGRHKKVKYELTSSSPFVTSIVPIAVI